MTKASKAKLPKPRKPAEMTLSADDGKYHYEVIVRVRYDNSQADYYGLTEESMRTAEEARIARIGHGVMAALGEHVRLPTITVSTDKP